MKKYLGLALSVISSLFLFSCDIGLGEVVDIDAPELTLRSMTAGGETKTNFGTTIYTKRNVVFKGSAWDNTGVENVHAEVKWLGDEDYKFLKNASVSGGEWTLDIDFGGREGACWLKIVSEDKKKNYGSKSAKVISLFVDEKAPVGDAWYIDRLVSGIQYSLQTKEALEEIISKDKFLNQPSNIDVAQNGEFKICSSFNDASGINAVSISIFDKDNNRLGTVTNTGSSNYAPQFLINTTTVPGLPDTGMHYLKVRYTAEDIVSDPSANKVEEADLDMGYFIWWPESDNPRCFISQEDSSSHNIDLHINDSLNVTVFDDDGFKTGNPVECKLYDAGNNVVDSKSVVPIEGQRECTLIITAPADAQTMSLKTTAIDKYNKTLTKENTVRVTDENHPTIIITAPENNQIPNVSGSDSLITFKGITLDSSGCTNLKFIWVSDSISNKKERALAWLNADSSAAPSDDEPVVVTSGTGENKGLKLYNVKLGEATYEGGLKKQEFEFTQSLTGDFGSDTNKDKYFYIRLIRKDGNYTDTELKLAADTIKPELELISPAGNMAIIDKDDVNGLVISFSAKKKTGVAIEPSKYKIEYIPPTGDPEEVTGSMDGTAYKSTPIKNEKLTEYYNSGKNPKYKLYAEDILGNKIDGTYEFIISSLPQINSISSSAPPLCKAGDSILINVSFTKPVSLNNTSAVKLKLANIKNGGSAVVRQGDYDSGSGSTTLVFKYVVQPGDVSTKLEVNNESGSGPVEGILETTAHMTVLPNGANLQDKKTIAIDGVAPKVTNTVVKTDAPLENINADKEYLKEGRTVTAQVTVGKKVTVQGAPAFKLGNLTLNWQSINYPDPNISVLTFSKKIVASDVNGTYTHNRANCITGLEYIKDDAGNPLSNPLTGNGTEIIVVDTKAPAKPVVNNDATNSLLTSGRYMSNVCFKITNVVQPADPEIKAEYSVDGGTNWTTYSGFGTTASTAPTYKEIKATSSVVNANLVTRITDRAGNVSEYSSPVSLEINNAFPSYTVECTNADKNYKEGKLTFKVYFASPVNIASTSSYIELTGNGDADVFGNTTHRATITEGSRRNNVSEATFEYTIQRGDSFTLKVAKGAVKLLGVTDLYGFTQNGLELDADYSRPNLRCDNIPPKVLTMTPGETKTPYTGKNIYANGKIIDLEFSEPVKVNKGKIYLRQTAGWAIPPMFEVSEFNRVLSAVRAAGNTGNGTLTGTRILYMDGQEDKEGPLFSEVGPANYTYHGTGQFVGPYKKTSQGLNADGKTPNYTGTKYVLDYDMDIWGNAGKKFGTTFNTENASRNNREYQAGQVVVLEGATTITTADIRQVLESIHFHERSVSVNSAAVVVDSLDKKKVTITLPNSFLGESALQPGLEWELVIEKGAFMDETGNFFGYEADGTKSMTDSRQSTNGSNDVSNTWSRGRTGTVTDPLVLIQDGANVSFLSSGVAKPVIRVDRYSYGLGIYQPKMENNSITRSFVQTEKKDINNNNKNKIIPSKPTAKVRVRIDCQTAGAAIRHTKTFASKGTDDATVNNGGKEGVTSYASDSFTGLTIPTAPANAAAGSGDIQFLSGSGDHKNSYVELIYSKAFFNGQSSGVEKEGVFQSVLCMVDPVSSDYTSCFGMETNNTVSVRGTTGWAGEPSISPFPLRDSAVGSAYLRVAYPDYYDGENKNYYWISYEILIDSSISIYSWGKSVNYYDWGQNWGLMKPGEFSKITGLRNWK
ncbi:hypothetical protein [Treponema sp.]|uniref:hypothetical protein n=1 Tax=Treponema sp. TaxID=166 RepID=UPI00388D1F7F